MIALTQIGSSLPENRAPAVNKGEPCEGLCEPSQGSLSASQGSDLRHHPEKTLSVQPSAAQLS
jgi:hypothetical protein